MTRWYGDGADVASSGSGWMISQAFSAAKSVSYCFFNLFSQGNSHSARRKRQDAH
jgi:hypothetical protein